MADLQKGIVVKSTGSWYHVRTSEGSVWSCRLAGKYRLVHSRTTNPLAVGDEVEFHLSADHEGSIAGRRPRHSEIIRRSRKAGSKYQVIAANIDQLVIIATLSNPRTSTGFIDRLLVSAEISEIPATIVFNKKDLWKAKEETTFDQLNILYKNAGYSALAVSAKNKENIAALKSVLRDKTSLLAGHSGTGKSSLMNCVNPSLNLHTRPVSKATQKGTHATTHAEMHNLFGETWIIDSPGIRDFGLLDLDPAVLSHYFREMKHYTGKCRFNNCLHQEEPGCIIKELVSTGQIPDARYNSYLRILNNMY